LPSSPAKVNTNQTGSCKKEPVKITRAHAAMLRVRVIVIPLETEDLLIRIELAGTGHGLTAMPARPRITASAAHVDLGGRPGAAFPAPFFA